jgi:hypothetical protein
MISALVWICPPAFGQQDIKVVGGTNPYIILGRNMSWVGSGFGNIGNSFIFTPTSPDEGFCLFVTNNNPTNSHTFSVVVSQTGDPGVGSFQGNQFKWSSVPTSATFPLTVNPAAVVGINYKTTASANIAVTFSGNIGAAGNPDTVDVFAVQTTQRSCGALPTNAVQGPFQDGRSLTVSQQFPVVIGGLSNPSVTSVVHSFIVGPNADGFALDSSGGIVGAGLFQSPQANSATPGGVKPGGVSAPILMPSLSGTGFGASIYFGGVRTNILEMGTDIDIFPVNSTPVFTVLGKLTNPVAGATILHSFDLTNAGRTLQYKWLILSCSAACEITVNRTNTQGGTCSALTIRNMQIGNNGVFSSPVAGDIAENNCTVAPTAVFPIYDLQLQANGVLQLDVGGILNGNGNSSGSGLDVISSAVTGIVTATLQFVEEQ